ncbi:MAG: hypothetical protein MUC48_11470 [Leptolyngbya sp. Prado105]|jgi:hypothetical protein|nr:hypothetical protein [Leptolyngbya sp. Prado105]
MTTTNEFLSTNKPVAKSIFASKTFWGAALTLLIAIAPKVGEEVDKYQNTGRVDGSSITQIVVLFGTTTLAIMGRIDAKQPLYTPDGLPGPNKSDFPS